MGRVDYRIVGAAAVGSILFKGMLIEFAFDTVDLDAVKQHKWHYASNTYIATSVKVDDTKKRELYLHSFLLKPPPTQTVQHINKNGLDNRRENLRLLSDSEAATGHAKKKRNVELPPLGGIRPDEIPKHIWYVQANGYHRDRFAIEFKTEGILWKSTSSKDVSLQEKLGQAKAKLEELYQVYPHLDPKREDEQVAALNESFRATLSAETISIS